RARECNGSERSGGDEKAMRKRRSGTGTHPPRLRPCFGPGLVQILDGERFVVEREPQLRRDEREPAPGARTDLLEPVLQPAAVLLHLTRHVAAAIARSQRLETAGRTREGADGQVPAAVGADERTPVHDS